MNTVKNFTTTPFQVKLGRCAGSCNTLNVWNAATYICENGKYLASSMDDSVITCVDVIESYDEEIKTTNKFY